MLSNLWRKKLRSKNAIKEKTVSQRQTGLGFISIKLLCLWHKLSKITFNPYWFWSKKIKSFSLILKGSIFTILKSKPILAKSCISVALYVSKFQICRPIFSIYCLVNQFHEFDEFNYGQQFQRDDIIYRSQLYMFVHVGHVCRGWP